jgi:hypothetical protein
MQVILIQSEIEDALRFYLNSRGLVVEGKAVTIEMKATRGDQGFTAELSITDEPIAAPAPAPTRRNAGVAAKVTAARTAPAANTETEEAPATEPEADEPPFATEETQAGSTTDTEVEAAPAKPSIFANLKKPTNNPDVAAA